MTQFLKQEFVLLLGIITVVLFKFAGDTILQAQMSSTIGMVLTTLCSQWSWLQYLPWFAILML